MSGQFSGSAVIDRPIQQVFDFLVAGTNDPKFSPRVLEIVKETDGPPGVGTVFVSRVRRRHEDRPPLRADRGRGADEDPLAERSKNAITVPEGGYDLEAVGDAQTKLTIFNRFEGHGFGKLIVGFALKAAIKDADSFAGRIKAAVEAE